MCWNGKHSCGFSQSIFIQYSTYNVCVCVCCIAKSQAYEISHTLQRRALFIKAKALSLSLSLFAISHSLLSFNCQQSRATGRPQEQKQKTAVQDGRRQKQNESVRERERAQRSTQRKTNTHTCTRTRTRASRAQQAKKALTKLARAPGLCDRSLWLQAVALSTRALSPHARSLPYLLTAATPYHSNDGGRRARELSVSFTARNRPAVENFERIRTRRT